jgi:biopolymer transport protein ExbB
VLDTAIYWLISPYTAVKELISAGGLSVVWIFLAGVVMWTLVFERYWYFERVAPRLADEMLREWLARKDRNSWYARQIRRAMISRLSVGMTQNFQVLRILVPLCPLLGLLGTITGMLEVFDAMAARGSADARAMASGVSQAMICALTGLAVSLTGLYPVHYFQSRARIESELMADKFEY